MWKQTSFLTAAVALLFPLGTFGGEPVAQPQPAVAAVGPIQLDLAPGADVRQAWETYFAQHEPEKDAAKLKKMTPEELKACQAQLVRQQQAVLETVQALKGGVADALKNGKQDEAVKKYEEIIALLEAALRHDQAQPWMYELLALSMKAAGRPQEDIDRAIMSAVEFTQNHADLMYLGAYLMRANMERRALQIFRQVGLAEPFWPEPLYHGMVAARKLHDLPGLEWSTSGILSQAWTPSQIPMWEDALRVAQATIKDLRDHQRNEEADHFQAVLDKALVRDCAVKVQWTGDADIDVMVKEPGGTVCSLRNQRTTSGGVLIGDMSDIPGMEKIDGHVALYACPKAFNGNYQVLIRRVFGKLNTGKVNVEVITHYYTKECKSFAQKIPVNDGEALVKFDLTEGRRKESVRDVQIANAAVAALGQRQAVLAQQLAVMNDPNAAAALGTVQQAAAAASSAQSQQLNPYAFASAWPTGLHGAVGYSPVIITLPEGTNFAATAVVSADRRYVRITCVPFFSQVSDVHTFSIDTGATASTPGIGTGGAGYSGVAGAGAGGVN